MDCNEIAGIGCFSALQRAENSSIGLWRFSRCLIPPFQCSSASRKFLNLGAERCCGPVRPGFSALQRAENSSMPAQCCFCVTHLTFQCSSASRKFLNHISSVPGRDLLARFQCSSASRKFLNALSVYSEMLSLSVSVLFSEPKIPQFRRSVGIVRRPARFSALQRAENSSMVWRTSAAAQKSPFQCSSASRKFLNVVVTHNEYPALTVSVLFSEPKIPQLKDAEAVFWRELVSVLFSEPKIPQSLRNGQNQHDDFQFQCSSASRKFLNACVRHHVTNGYKRFQCSSASRKFLNTSILSAGSAASRCFSALQRAENSSILSALIAEAGGEMFQCSSASRKFLNQPNSGLEPGAGRVSVLFSEPKIPQYNRIRCFSGNGTVSVLFSEPKIPQWNWSFAGA